MALHVRTDDKGAELPPCIQFSAIALRDPARGLYYGSPVHWLNPICSRRVIGTILPLRSTAPRSRAIRLTPL
jgi:hypothetical protein